ncbi:uncharacterized protein LOC135809577 isoform X2 [Sycon ciliatum]|uniref:uncharacterized protein LOC135809577 isoform X2 n=1 Tax=Sycon ciliatum TaxID=27933 RepID=UPI0031F6E485
MANTETISVPPGEHMTIDDTFDGSASRSGFTSLGKDESIHRLNSLRENFECDSPSDSLSADSLCGAGDQLTSRLDVYCGGTVGSSGSGTASIVRLKNGIIQWASLPRNKRSTTNFSETQADNLLDSASSLSLDLVITAKLRVKTNKQGREEVTGFTVLGAQANKTGRNGGPLLSTLTVHFTKAAARVSQEWVYTINNALLVTGLRPQKLLFFINPMAGKGDAALIYQQSVRPYLKAADIEADVMLLSGPGSMRKYLSDPTRDLHQYDGIVAVGGDGTINELINISIFRAIESKVTSVWSNADPKDDSVPEHEFSIEQIRKNQHRIGVIPAGSINHIACSVFGSDSPAIATIHTLLGGSYLLDVCSLSTQKRLLTFGTTAVFSCLQNGCKSPKSPKRKLLRLSSSQQFTTMKLERDGDFFTTLRYQMTHVDRVEKNKSSETWSTDPNPGENFEMSSLTLSPLIEVAPGTDNLSACPVTNKWGTLTGTYGYLCIFATPYRDPEHPTASSQEGLLDMILADTLSRKDYFRNALKKKFTSDQNASGAVICHAQQAFININVPRQNTAGTMPKFRKKASTISSPLDMIRSRRLNSEDDDVVNETDSAEVSSTGTIYSTIEIDADVTIGHLKGISWSSIQTLAGEPGSHTPTHIGPGKFAWYIDGDPIAAKSVHVCMLPKIVNFLAMPLDLVVSVK